jgi:hypothetical protein
MRDSGAKEERMRARALFAAAVGVLLVIVASPAVAKVGIAEARISGPGLGEGGLRISAPATEGMWDLGIDVVGGLDDARAHSVVEFGLTAAELGPRYLVMYRLDAGTKAAEIVRQELYPYANGGPVTYVPPGQRVAEDRPWGGAITAGWYQGSMELFDYLVDHGLPESSPVVMDESARDGVLATGPAPWGWISLALAGLVALSVAAPWLHRRRGVARRSAEA